MQRLRAERNLCAGVLSRRDDGLGHIGTEDGVAVYFGGNCVAAEGQEPEGLHYIRHFC